MEARYPGDPRGRPSRAFCSVSATGSIRRRRDELIDKAVVCSFDGNSHEVNTLSAGDMLREKFNLHHGQYQLVKHFPEQFFIIFSDPRSKLWALDRRSVSYRGRIFHFGDWSEDSYARKTNLEFRVKVRVEGIPVHCWGEEVASKALGKSCAIHYVQERTRRRERTRSFDLWAWCSDPCDIPKEVQLTVLEPDRELPPVSTPLPLSGAHHDEPSDLKTGHVYTLRNHIEVVEDLSFLHGRGSRGAPNRKQRREFVWNYGAPDSLGEKRGRTETFRGRETVRRDWGHDDDEGDFQRDRRSGNRRHRSLSGWARSSRCRGGMDDCYSSNDKHRHSTPFRRHGLGMSPPTRCWVPKRKGKTVSFADPVVSAVWPQVGGLELAAGVGSSPGSVGGVNQEASHDPDASKCKVTNSVDLNNVFATILNSLDSVLALKNSIPAKAPAVQPSEFLGSQLVNDNQAVDHNLAVAVLNSLDNALTLTNSTPAKSIVVQPAELLGSQLVKAVHHNLPAAERVDQMGAPSIHNLSYPVFQSGVSDNHPMCQPDFQPVDNNNHETLRVSPALKTGNSLADNTQLTNFIAEITTPPEPPLIPSLPKSNTTNSPHTLKIQKQPITRRSSVRLAAKKNFKTGTNRDAISKAQEIIRAKLNNSAVKIPDGSISSDFADFDDSFEQIASLFTRPLTKNQMEAIMELINQDNVKAGKTKKKGRKVVPTIEAVKAKGF
jgi:hypothetical protein